MVLVKLYSNGSGTPLNVELSGDPPPCIFIKDKLYTLINQYLVSETGYNKTYYYGQVNFLVVENP